MRKYLTVNDIIYIHKNIINRFGGIHGIREKDALNAAVMRPQSGYYKDIVEEAAALMESLAMNHCFLDGNKRISFFATDLFLRINGYYISCNSDETNLFYIQNLSNNSFRFKNVIDWLKDKIERLD